MFLISVPKKRASHSEAWSLKGIRDITFSVRQAASHYRRQTIQNYSKEITLFPIAPVQKAVLFGKDAGSPEG